MSSSDRNALALRREALGWSAYAAAQRQEQRNAVKKSAIVKPPSSWAEGLEKEAVGSSDTGRSLLLMIWANRSHTALSKSGVFNGAYMRACPKSFSFGNKGRMSNGWIQFLVLLRLFDLSRKDFSPPLTLTTTTMNKAIIIMIWTQTGLWLSVVPPLKVAQHENWNAAL